MTMTTTAPPQAGTNTKQKVGLVICALYGLSNVPTFLFPPDTGDQDGPPMAILVVAPSSAPSAWSPRSWPGAATGCRCGSRPAR